MAVGRVERIIPEFLVLHQIPQRVDAETVNALGKPRPQHILDGNLDRRIAPIKIGLGLKKSVVIILVGRLIEFPTAASENGQPIVWRPAVRCCVTPDIPIPVSC